MRATVFFDGAGWRPGVVERVDGVIRLSASDEPARDLPWLGGAVCGGFTDHHVHLQLVDHTLLRGSTLGRVVDLGGNPGTVGAWARESAVDPRQNSGELPPAGAGTGRIDAAGAESPELRRDSPPHRTPRIAFAGAFLTPRGGYPSGRDWAPRGSVREIADAEAASAAIAEMAAAGTSRIKVASNAHAGPVFDDGLFRAIVELARGYGLPVVAHAEGRGEAQRAARLGAAQLAHAPFTERLDDREIAAQAASVEWISTLAIHSGADLSVALDNTRRFHAAGGILRYGTDMGNGPTPVRLHPLEVAALRDAGLDDAALLRALAPVDPLDPFSVLLLLPEPPSANHVTPSALPTGAALATCDPLSARPLTPDDLKV